MTFLDWFDWYLLGVMTGTIVMGLAVVYIVHRADKYIKPPW